MSVLSPLGLAAGAVACRTVTEGTRARWSIASLAGAASRCPGFVSAPCRFGEQNTEAEGHAQLDYALGRGITLFDASEIYPVPAKPETQGRTEAIIGTWLAARKHRDRVTIATKVAGRGKITWLRQDRAATRRSSAQIMEAVEDSQAPQDRLYRSLSAASADRPMRVFEGLNYLRWKATATRSMRSSPYLGAGRQRQGHDLSDYPTNYSGG